MIKKGVIFDLDGVLVHTDYYHYLAWKAIADKLKIKFDEEINNKLRGVSRMESLEIILQYNSILLSEDEKTTIAKQKNQVYRDYLMQMSPKDVDETVRRTIFKLKDEKIKIAIGSSSRNAKLILEKTELYDYFDAISDGNNITYSKPHPEVFLKAAEYLKLEPKDCLVVEDALAGVQAGLAGGFETAAIGDAAKYNHATYKLEKIEDLLDILLNN
ncbi:MAG: beta-phosphoglucomutase [Clostridiales bacterium]|nr:beta-phosphoglucomutase [Clostridiales bacterium]